MVVVRGRVAGIVSVKLDVGEYEKLFTVTDSVAERDFVTVAGLMHSMLALHAPQVSFR